MTAAPNGPGPRARTVFFGSGAFAVPVLEALAGTPQVELVGVISAPDRPAGRKGIVTPAPLAARARELRLPLLQPERLRDPAAIAAVAALEPALGVLADYGQIVPSVLLEVSDRGILNVHPSLLPRHRGASPIAATILAGDRETGVTLIAMDAGLDTGPIVARVRWPLSGDETGPQLEERASREGADLVARTVGPWLAGTAPATSQPSDGVTLTRPLRRADGRLDPTLSAAELERQVRAYQPWPGSFIEADAGRIVAWRAGVEAGDATTPGTFGPGPDLRLATTDGWLLLDEVQLAGGRRMTGRELLIGRPGLAGSRAAAP